MANIKTGKIIKCLICGKEFYVPHCRIKTAKYCSKRCLDISQRGKKLSEEHRQKLIEAARRPKSEEAKKKMSLAKLRNPSIHKPDCKCRICENRRGNIVRGKDHPGWTRIKKKCAFCEKTITIKRSAVRENNFCNLKCFGKWQRINGKGKNNPMYGKKQTQETRLKIRRKSRKRFKDIGERIKASARRLGISLEEWNGFKSKLRDRIRRLDEYKQWRKHIFERDNYTCILCNKGSNRLHVHHCPKSFSKILKDNKIRTLEETINCKELWDIGNGVTLCEKCHKRTDNYLNSNHKLTKNELGVMDAWLSKNTTALA